MAFPPRSNRASGPFSTSEFVHASIRETARLVGRDVENVHDELRELERLGLVRFEREGRAKRSGFPCDEVAIALPFGGDDTPDGAPGSS